MSYFRQLTGSHGWVESVYIKAEMDWFLPVGVDVVHRHLDNLSNSILVDLVHGICLDSVFLENLLLCGIDISKTNVDSTPVSGRFAR
jgi:hypothetical protein